MHKATVRRSFNRAAASYDAAAALQRRVCDLLLSELDGATPAAMLDAGCGTGYGLRLLGGRWPGAWLAAADFAPAMLTAVPGHAVCADIEALPFRTGAFDLFWSSLTVQWCDAARVAAEAARVLAPGGHLAVSSLAPGTLAELDRAFAGADGHRHVLEFTAAESLATACIAAGFEHVRLTRKRLRLHAPDLRTLLRELKALGANQVGAGRRRGLFGRRGWQAVEARYEALREPEGLPATYEVILCHAIRPT